MEHGAGSIVHGAKKAGAKRRREYVAKEPEHHACQCHTQRSLKDGILIQYILRYDENLDNHSSFVYPPKR